MLYYFEKGYVCIYKKDAAKPINYESMFILAALF